MVSNLFPAIPTTKRIAIIGEAPGADEEKVGRPFVGASGQFLGLLLSRAGISKDACFLGNISQHRPPENNIMAFSWNGPEIQHGLNRLAEDLETFNPNLVVLLGNIPLKAALDPLTPLSKKAKFSNANWRGSLFRSDNPSSPFHGLKCLPSYHPAYVLRDYDTAPLLQLDLRKAVREGGFRELYLPHRNLEVQLSEAEQIHRLRNLRLARRPTALDIEGYIDAMTCISFANDPTSAFIIPINNSTTWQVWKELALTLEDPELPKVLQNSLYDRFVLHYSYGIRVRGVIDDTMLKHWELYSELEKALAVQASIYTDEPYYKSERKSDDWLDFYRYCCKDSAITLEINQKVEPMLSGVSKTHYRLNMSMLNPMLYMELRGMRYSVIGAWHRRQALLTKLHEKQAEFNLITGHCLKWTSLDEIKARVRSLFWTKKGDRVYKDYIEANARVKALWSSPNPSLATIGEIENLLEISLNLDSPKQVCEYFYDKLKLPVQMSYPKRGDPKPPHPTVDYEALLNLSRELRKNNDSRIRVIELAIEISSLATRAGMLSISADRDGRIRCGYNIVGTNTGRVSCYTSPTGSGYNLTTIPNYTEALDAPGGVLGDRDLFLADPDYWFFQCDLAGADGWTVAAYCAMLGDSVMLEHYRAGIKPYAVLAYKMLGIKVNYKDTQELAALARSRKLTEEEKTIAKPIQHGGAYLEGGLTMSRNILKKSEGKLYVSPDECKKLKDWYIYEMYPGVTKWHNWIEARIKERPVLVAASGQVRQFFGRPGDILTKAVAFEPQANTTYATNLAMHRLWSDSANRWKGQQDKVHLRIQPLHQVHDALCGQFPKRDAAWAVAKIKSYFSNTLKIAGQDIMIPFEGGYGESWGQLTNKI